MKPISLKFIMPGFQLDLRSLGLARVAFAVLILTDLCLRSLDLQAHYTDYGLLPRIAIIEHPYSRWDWSFHLMSGTWQIQVLLFFIAAVFAILLLLGYHTRLATIVSWALMVSLNSRNPLIVVGDTLFRALLFWAIFLPWGNRFSIDALRNGNRHQFGETYCGAASFAYVMQLIFVFWFGVIHKSGAEWRIDGTALYYALSFEHFTSHFGLFLLQFPWLLRVATHAAFWIEAISPLLLVFPVSNGPLRTIGIGLLMLLMFSILLAMNIGIFIWVTAAGLLALLPVCFWNKTNLWVRTERCNNSAYRGALNFVDRTRIKLSDYFSSQAPRIGSASHFYSLKARWISTCVMIKDIAILGLVYYVFLWNAAGVTGSPVRLSERERILGNLLALDQEWGMFAPFPSKNGGWYVIPGRLGNGKVVDLFNDGAPVTWAKPPLVSATFKSFRWQKYMQTIRNQRHAAYRKYYGAYLCRVWNRGHTGELQLASLEVVYVLEMTLPNYEYFTPTKVVAFTHQCAG